MAFCLVNMLTVDSIPHKYLFQTTVFVVVIFTVFVQVCFCCFLNEIGSGLFSSEKLGFAGNMYGDWDFFTVSVIVKSLLMACQQMNGIVVCFGVS